MKDAAVTLIVGRRGSGKSTATKALMASARRVIVYDPLSEYRHLAQAQSVKDIRDHMVAGRSRVAYVPPSADHIRCLSAVASWVWRLQGGYAASADGRGHEKILLVVEEANLAYPARPLPDAYRGICRATLQGRHAGIEIIAVTQRPALVSADLRGQVSRLIIFAQAHGQDIQALAQIIGREHVPRMRVLQNFEAIKWEHGTVTPYAEQKKSPRRKSGA